VDLGRRGVRPDLRPQPGRADPGRADRLGGGHHAPSASAPACAAPVRGAAVCGAGCAGQGRWARQRGRDQRRRAHDAAFNLDAAQRAEAIARFNAGKQAGFQLAPALGELRRICAPQPQLAWAVLDVLAEVAYAEGAASPAGFQLLQQTAHALGFGDMQLLALLMMRGYAMPQGARGRGSSRAIGRLTSKAIGGRPHRAAADLILMPCSAWSTAATTPASSAPTAS